MGQESCRPRILFGMSFALHYTFAIYLHCRAIQHKCSRCLRVFDLWVAGNVAGLAQNNMLADVSADLFVHLFVILFVELFVDLCVNRFVDLFVYPFVDQTLSVCLWIRL